MKTPITPLTVGKLIKMLNHLPDDEPVWVLKSLFTRERLEGVHIDDDGTLVLIPEGNHFFTENYGNAVAEGGIQGDRDGKWPNYIVKDGKLVFEKAIITPGLVNQI